MQNIVKSREVSSNPSDIDRDEMYRSDNYDDIEP